MYAKFGYSDDVYKMFDLMYKRSICEEICELYVFELMLMTITISVAPV